jgi:hypothetical protein
MASEVRRQSGGQNNRKGNRYEDAFAVFRSIQLAPGVIHLGQSVRLREQAGCRVDDLLIREESRRHYYQLKDRQTITWNWERGKLREDFAAQLQQCRDRLEDFTLTVVVSHDHRKQLLDDSMPDALKEAVAVYHFPAVKRMSELAQQQALQEPLRNISAIRSAGRSHLRSLVEGFALAWLERELDGDGDADLGQMVAYLREHHPHFLVRRPLPRSIHPAWERFLDILSGIPDLAYRYDRGYLEWSSGPRYSSFIEHPCDSEGFRRFVDRVLEKRPTTLEELERERP